MPHFMVSCNYSAESKNALISNPIDRTKAASAAVEAVGGKLHSAFMTFGETDIIVIYEAPDAIASAALAMTLGASGGFSSIKTTALLTTADAVKALKLSGETRAGYKPPASDISIGGSSAARRNSKCCDSVAKMAAVRGFS